VNDPPRTYVVGDVHGHRTALAASLRQAGLIDEDESWCAGDTRLWFLGDFFDRGPDGVGVVDLVMRLSEQAAAAGGWAGALMGNHEVLALGMYRFGDRAVPSDIGPRSFGLSWRLNGGMDADQRALTDHHVAWLSELPALAHAGDHLLMHSDTFEYLSWGQTVEDINTAVREVLAGDDLGEWWECWCRLSTRYAFRGPYGAQVADGVLSLLGGARIVHGHSIIADQLGIEPAEVRSPVRYAGGKVLGVDGGLFVGGPCLVVPLPWEGEGSAPVPLAGAISE